jgi:hypothetical protein
MLGIVVTCGEILSLAAMLYGAWLAIRHFDIVKGRAGASLANDDVRFLRAPVLQEPATASAWPPSRARFSPGAAGEQPAAAGVFLPCRPTQGEPS